MRIAVTGGTGRIGGQVVELLTAAGGHEVVALSSRTAPYDHPSALRTALDGVDTLVFVSSDGEAARVIVHHRNVVQAAIQCQVGHVVLLSSFTAVTVSAGISFRSALARVTDRFSGAISDEVRLTPEATREFIDRARRVVAAGRPPCPLCGQPLDPAGHLCPRHNGYHR